MHIGLIASSRIMPYLIISANHACPPRTIFAEATSAASCLLQLLVPPNTGWLEFGGVRQALLFTLADPSIPSLRTWRNSSKVRWRMAGHADDIRPYYTFG